MSNLLKSKFLTGVAMATMILGGVAAFNAATALGASCTITTTLRVGSKGADVQCLQSALGISADGSFGPKTKAAVVAWQSAHNLAADGVFGAMSRNAWTGSMGVSTYPAGCTSSTGFSSTTGMSCGTTVTMTYPAGCSSTSGFSPTTGMSCSSGSTTTTVTQQTGPVSVSLSSDNPASGYIVGGQAGADLAHFAFSGSGTVNSVTLMRTGVSDSNTLSNVYLYDGATRLTSGYSFNTTGTLTMNGLNIAVNGSKIISVKGDVNVGASASSLGVTLVGFTSAGNAAQTVNVMSNVMTYGTSTLAGANITTAAGTPGPAATSINAGSMNQNLWSRSMTVSNHSVYLHALTVKMIGSAPTNTLGNVTLYVDGVNVATTTVNSNNQFVFTLGTTPLLLQTGSHLIEVHGDVIGGAYRNFYLSLEQGTDLAIEDAQMKGVYVSTTAGSVTAVNVNGGTITVNNGTLTVNQDTAFNNTTTLVGGSTNTTMASFVFKSYGEDVKVTSLSFTPTFTTLSSGTTLANVGLYVNGGQVGSNQTATNNTTLTFTGLGSQLLVPAGVPTLVQIKGDVVSSVGNTNITSGTIQFSVSTGSAQGMTSSQTTTVPSAGGQSLVVSTTNVNFATTTGFSTSTVAPNQTVKVGSFTLQTGSAEGVTVNTISMDDGGTAVAANQVTNLTIKNDSTGQAIGNPIGNPVATGNSFSVTVPVNKSSTKVFSVYATLGSNAAGLTVIPKMTITYRGSTSNITTTSAQQTGPTVTANVATIDNATGTALVGSSSPSAQYVIGGSTTNNIATFNIKTSNAVGGAVTKDMTFTVPNNTISTITVNGQTGSVVGTTATVYNTGISIPADASGVSFPVGVTFVCANTANGCSGSSNSNVTLTLTSYTFNNGSTIATVTNAGNTHNVSPTDVLVATKPTVSVTSPTGAVVSVGLVEAIDVTVTADPAGTLKLTQFPITATLTGANPTPAFTTAAIQVEDASGNIIDSTGSGTCAAAAACGTINVVLNNGYTLGGAGNLASQTFRVFLPVGAVGTGSAPATTLNASLATGSAFQWTDVSGNNTAITGTSNIYNYPTNTTRVTS